MNICKRCGKENQEHYKFCLGCGGELTASGPAGGGGGGGAQKTIMAGALSPLAMPPSAASGAPGTSPPLGAPPRGATPTPPAGMAAVGAPPLGPPPLGPPPGSPGFAPSPFPPPGSGNVSSPPPDSNRTIMAGNMGGAGPSAPPWAAATAPSSAPPFAAQAPSSSPFPPSPPPGGGFAPPPPLYTPPPQPFSSPPVAAQFSPPSQPYPAPPAGGSPFTPPGSVSPPFTPVSPPSFGQPPQSASHGVVATRACTNCGTEVPVTFLFCGACGTRLDVPSERPSTAGGLMPQPGLPGVAPMPFGAGPGLAPVSAPLPPPQPVVEPKPHGRLTLIRPDGSEGGTHELTEGDNSIGRQNGSLFENDGYLSPRHAEIVVGATSAVIRDVGSLNGVFAKMTQEEELSAGDVFRIGQELLRYDLIPAPQPLEDGTDVMGSPNPGYWGRLSVIIGKDIDGSAYPLFGDAVTIGRERGDINFPDDGYVSGLHARVSFRDGKAYLADLGSSNGTFMRLRGERVVTDGAFILFGQQLFRVNLMMM